MIETISISENEEMTIKDYIKQMFEKSFERKNLFFINPFSIYDLADSLNLPKFENRNATLNLILNELDSKNLILIFDFVGIGKQNYIFAGMTEKDYCKLQREKKLKLVEAVKPITGGNYNLYSINQYINWRNNKNYFNDL